MIPLDIYPKYLKSCGHVKNLYVGVYNSLIHNCQNLEVTRIYFVGEWINKLKVHPDNGILCSAKKNVKPWKDMEGA